MNAKKSPGLDELHPRVIKNLGNILVEPLFYIFNLFLKNGKLSSVWKFGSILAISKTFSKTKVVEIMQKMIDQLVYRERDMSQLTDTKLKATNILSDQQFDFLTRQIYHFATIKCGRKVNINS